MTQIRARDEEDLVQYLDDASGKFHPRLLKQDGHVLDAIKNTVMRNSDGMSVEFRTASEDTC